MNFVGDVFGAPLAMEGLLAFFLESTFLGLWIFGWSVLPKRKPGTSRTALPPPSRSDLTSVPVSAMPASKVSSMK